MLKIIATLLTIAGAFGLFALSYCRLGLPALDAGIVPAFIIVVAVGLAVIPPDDGHGGCA